MGLFGVYSKSYPIIVNPGLITKVSVQVFYKLKE